MNGKAGESKSLLLGNMDGGSLNLEEMAMLQLIHVMNVKETERDNCWSHVEAVSSPEDSRYSFDFGFGSSLDCAADLFSSSSIPFGLDEAIQCLMDHPSQWGKENSLLKNDSHKYLGSEASVSHRQGRGKNKKGKKSWDVVDVSLY